MSSEAQVALVTGLFTVAGILVGAVVGWLLNARTQERAEKRAAIVEFLAALDACQHGAIRLHSAVKVNDEDRQKQEVDLMLAALARVDSARSVAALVLPESATSTLWEGVNACVEDYNRATGEAEWAGQSAIIEAWTRVLALGKRELGYK